MPRLWPKLFTEEAFEEIVLLRLGAALFEETEYADELVVEATESCRNGLKVEVPISVCDRLKADGCDITLCRAKGGRFKDES